MPTQTIAAALIKWDRRLRVYVAQASETQRDYEIPVAASLSLVPTVGLGLAGANP